MSHATFNHPSEVCDTKETMIAKANGDRMRGCLSTVHYLQGKFSPNYPVPAIPLIVHIKPAFVVISQEIEHGIDTYIPRQI